MKILGYLGKLSFKNVIGVLAIVVITSGLAVFASSDGDTPFNVSSQDLFKQIQVFSDAITLIDTDYVKKLEVKDLIHGAIKGMMNTLDGYSQFLDEDSFQDIKEETKGEFGGIGVEIGIRDGVLTVITPMEGTPAAESGIESGDKVVKINGDITRDITLDEAVRKLRGLPGSEVSITVMRDNGEMMDVTLKRTIIKLQSVKESKMISGDIAYIKLVEFQKRTAKDIDVALRKLKKDGASGLVLDLRNNPGGLLDSAIEVSEKFLKKGTLIVYTEGRDPADRADFFSRKTPKHADIDIVVLINKGSASAAEILAGALQDNKRALLVGEVSFGKGSVQTVIPLRDSSALRLTTAAYYTPAGRNLMDKGIEPDICVQAEKRKPTDDMLDDEGTEERSDPFEGLEKGSRPGSGQEEYSKICVEPELKDEQIRTAVNILKGVRVFEANKKKLEQKEVSSPDPN